MNSTKSHIKTSLFIVLIVLSICALGFIGASVGVFLRYRYVENNFIKVDAVISTVNHSSEDAFVTFTPDGETTPIEVKLNSYSSSYYEGKEIVIYYNPDNYHEVSSLKELAIISIVFFVIGIIQLITGFIPLIIFTALKAKAKYYKTHFKKERANVIGIKTNYSFSIGNAHPHTISYKTKDGKYLKTTDYSSRFTNYEEGLVIDVYKNDKNGKYYADPESIRKEEIIEDDIFSIDKDKF